MLPQLVNIISNFILPAFIIGFYGSKINGLISTSKSIISYISLVGAGIAVAVTQQLYAPVAKHDDETVKGMLNSASKMFFRYGVIFCVILILVALIYPFFVEDSVGHLTVSLLLLVMGLQGASEFFVVGRCRAILYANQKVYVCTLIQAVSLLISLGCAILMIKIETSIILVQLAISLVYVSRAILLQSYVSKKYPQYKDYKNSKPIDSAVSKRKDAMLHQLAGLAVMSSQSLILTTFVSLEAASIYAVYHIVFAGISAICTNISTAITPYLGRGLALDDKKKITKKYDLTELFFNVLTTFIFSVCAFMLMPFIMLYTKGADINYLYQTFGILFLIAFSFHVLRLPGVAIINVAGHFKETRIRAIIEAVICVVISIISTLLIGLEGVLIGTGCALGWRAIDIIVYSNKNILNRSSLKSIFRAVRCLLIVILSCVISLKIDLNISSYLSWIIHALIISIIIFVFVAIETIIFELNLLKGIIVKRENKGK